MQERPSKETALSVVLSSRSYGSSTVLETRVPSVEARNVRKLFCESLKVEPVAAPALALAPASGATVTAGNTRDVGTKTEDTRSKPALAVAPGEPVQSSKAPKTLKDSRWAKDDTKANCELQTLKWSRWAERNQKDAPQHMDINKRPPRQISTGHNNKTRWAKDEEKEVQPEPPRVNFDWEEFEREVKENNLKTLKDSRWA
ncbi:hypothetical protein F5B21DRAFT_528312 [Xylaria acuta]|nr:hypothetical protein F5B21DRAFT_528312 [Xylaria acuta]